MFISGFFPRICIISRACNVLLDRVPPNALDKEMSVLIRELLQAEFISLNLDEKHLVKIARNTDVLNQKPKADESNLWQSYDNAKLQVKTLFFAKIHQFFDGILFFK